MKKGVLVLPLKITVAGVVHLNKEKARLLLA